MATHLCVNKEAAWHGVPPLELRERDAAVPAPMNRVSRHSHQQLERTQRELQGCSLVEVGFGEALGSRGDAEIARREACKHGQRQAPISTAGRATDTRPVSSTHRQSFRAGCPTARSRPTSIRSPRWLASANVGSNNRQADLEEGNQVRSHFLLRDGPTAAEPCDQQSRHNRDDCFGSTVSPVVVQIEHRKRHCNAIRHVGCG